jgi:hypothetical protein
MRLTVVVDVALTEAEGRSARVEVGPVVVGVGHTELHVLAAIRVGVADKRCLPVVGELRPRNGDTVRAMGNVEETIVVVLVMVAVRGKVNVVNPDLGRLLDTDGITSTGEHLGDLEVTDDNVLDLNDTDANTIKS